MNFIKIYDSLYPMSEVQFIRFFMNEGRYYKFFTARIFWKGHTEENPQWGQLQGQAAVDLAFRLDPNVLEGNPEFKFPKRAWAFHNLIAHPLMQILSFLGFVKLGLRIHDSTIPKPLLNYPK
jgi:hypothetical protein